MTSSPCMIAITGLSGSGKSTLCRALQEKLQGQGLAVTHIASDITRKDLLQVSATTRLPKSAYDWSVTKKVIHAMQKQSISALKAGDIVLYDALLDHPKARKDVAKIAKQAEVPFYGFWLSLPDAEIKKRIITRTERNDDASDATLEILEMQLERQKHVTDWPHIDATKSIDVMITHILDILKEN